MLRKYLITINKNYVGKPVHLSVGAVARVSRTIRIIEIITHILMSQ